MDSVDSIDSLGFEPRPRAFTVLIPRALQPFVDRLPPETRQYVMAELFRLAAQSSCRISGDNGSFTSALNLEVADCLVRVEMDVARSRLMLTQLVWQKKFRS
ncbi:hypothetical protein [Stigmatella erecta]|uniref:Uncharacterized protein n=1 Tax=Stigmatella erecta TaxID=83460 RepID=A0A1I0KY19_9BACT|nr:hypothetical protein [Stigmatella erecta]SEU31447.1 hypothetical protein SAMN05443639_11639 [Stigmatella erecta]